jgi:hypothetical protein
MSIPDFDHNQVIPPHLGDPRIRAQLSPYQTTSEEVCQKFATSEARRDILRRWLQFRGELTKLGVISGFQWLDGSFLEKIEVLETRDPHDLDTVTFYVTPAGKTPAGFTAEVVARLPEFVDRDLGKKNFKIDHFPVTLTAGGPAIVENTRYWAGLFSHRRDGLWKGMLRVELNTPAVDIAAASLVQSAAAVAPVAMVPPTVATATMP